MDMTEAFSEVNNFPNKIAKLLDLHSVSVESVYIGETVHLIMYKQLDETLTPWRVADFTGKITSTVSFSHRNRAEKEFVRRVLDLV